MSTVAAAAPSQPGLLTGLGRVMAKDVAQHLMTWLLLLGFGLLIVLVQYAVLTNSGGGVTDLALVPQFARWGMPIFALIIGQRLVAAEYYDNTQRFIEALPLRRGALELSKYVLGFCVVLALLVVVWLVTVILAVQNEPIGPQFAGFMFLRIVAYVFALWSAVFLVNLLGRLRLLLLFVALGAIWWIDANTSFVLEKFGPWAMLSAESFPFERDIFPVAGFLQCFAIGLICLVLAVLLLRLSEGSLVERLATPMTAREKIFVSIIAITGIGSFLYLGAQPEPAAVEFTADEVLRSDVAPVEVMYLDEVFAEDGAALLSYLEDRIGGFGRFSGLDGSAATGEEARTMRAAYQTRKLRIALAPSARKDEFDTRVVDDENGVVVSANFESDAGYRVENLGAFVMHQYVLANWQLAADERRHWLLDGISQRWAEYGPAAPPQLGTQFERGMLQGLFVARNTDVTEQLLREWDRTAERLGELPAMALAFTGVRVLEEMIGRDKLQAYVTAELGRPGNGNVLDWWYSRHPESIEVFAEQTGLSWSEFVVRWQTRLGELAAAPVYAEPLSTLPELTFAHAVEVTRAGSRIITLTVSASGPVPLGSQCEFLHRSIPQYDYMMSRGSLYDERREWPITTTELKTELYEYASYERLFVAADCTFPELTIPMRTGMQRLVLP